MYGKVDEDTLKEIYEMGLLMIAYILYRKMIDGMDAFTTLDYIIIGISYFLLPVSNYVWEGIMTAIIGSERFVSSFKLLRTISYLVKQTILFFLTLFIAPFGIINLYRKYKKEKVKDF
jgi:cytochrome c oxidase assembly factor CtaG